MKNLITFAVLALSALSFSSCDGSLLGLEDSGVFGVVIDAESGNPIPHAYVYINGPETKSTQADGNGNYRFDNMRAGNYVVSAEAYRYLTQFENVTVFQDDFSQADVRMDYHSLLSTHELDFGTNQDELEIVVTNLFDRPIDVDTDESEGWMTTHGFISGLEPGQSAIFTVRVNRTFMDPGTYSVPLVVDIEEDFGFDVFESYVVTVNVTKE